MAGAVDEYFSRPLTGWPSSTMGQIPRFGDSAEVAKAVKIPTE
jgi:hypothetical protein